jgi:hypothetical protein
MAVAAVLVTFAGRNIMLVAAVTYDNPPDPAEDRPMRHHQQHDERQPPVGEVDGKQVERNSHAKGDKAQRCSNPGKPGRFRGFNAATRFTRQRVMHVIFLSSR